MTRLLLRMESCLAIPVFIATWMICAIGFSARAGFQMAKLGDAEKRKMLAGILKGKP